MTTLKRHPGTRRSVDRVRGAALALLNRCEAGDKTLDYHLDRMMASEASMDARDRSFLVALVFGVMRWRARLDWMLSRFSRTPLTRMDPGVLNLLRMAAFQITRMDRVPDAAAVTTAVELAKGFAGPHVVRFVNGVLRNFVRGCKGLVLPDPAVDPVTALSVACSYPPWMVRRWVARWGVEGARRWMDAMNQVPPITLRPNPLRTDAEALLARLTSQGLDARPAGHMEGALHVISPRMAVTEFSGFSSGHFQVQDEAAQLVTHLVDPKPGESVLDACAGLGGKTGHLASLMENRGRILATDTSGEKLSRLMDEMARLGVENVTPLAMDWTRLQDPLKEIVFDRVLVDAPCSGIGVLRRNPDAKWRSSERALTGFGERQQTLLSRAAPRVRPGGVLVYAVCSTEPEENEAVVSRFLSACPDFSVDRNVTALPACVKPFLDDRGCFRTFTHRDGMDGFFGVPFRRHP